MRLLLAILVLGVLTGCTPGAERAPAVAAVDPAGPPVIASTGASLMQRARNGAAEVTIVSVWATWCAPCREKFPAMLATSARHEGRVRLLLLSADFDDQVAEARAFLASQGYADTSWIKSEKDQEFIDSVHPQWSGALPATLVFDREGRLSAFWEGSADSARFENAVQKALTPEGGPS